MRGIQSLTWLLVVLLVAATGAQADSTCRTEIEPNDQAAQAETLQGSFCFAGSIGDREQDLIIWDLSAADAANSWNLEVHAELGQRIQLRIHTLAFTPDHIPTIGPEIHSLQVQPMEGNGKDAEVLFRPGKYVVGILANRTGSYRIEFKKNTEDIKREIEPNDEAATASTIIPETVVGGDLFGSEDFYRWRISPADARRRWQIRLNTPKEDWVSVELTRQGASKPVETYSNHGLPLEASDLGLDAGDYLIHIFPKPSASIPYLLSLKAVGPRLPTREEEPNDTFAQLNPLTLGRSMGGRIGRQGDIDIFGLDVSAALAGKQITVKVDGPSSGKLEVCLLDKAGKTVPCRKGATPILKNLILTPGRQAIQISGEPNPEHPYTLLATLSGVQEDDSEIEPNDTTETATDFTTQVTGKGAIRGYLDDQDTDIFRLTVEGAPELWNFEAIGDGVSNVTITDDQKRVIGSGQSLPSAKSTEATEVYLFPGTYFVTVAGKNVAYALSAKSSGPPDISQEREPNDTDADAQRLSFGVTRHGKLPDTSDRDCYRFSLAAPEHVSLELDPPKDGDISFEVEWGYPSSKKPRVENVTQHATFDALLEPGDYSVRLRANKPSQERYSILLNRLDIFNLPADLEPNDSAPQAGPLPTSLTVSGDVGRFSDDDWYTLPTTKKDSAFLIVASGNVDLKLQDITSELTADWNADTHTLKAKVPANHLVRLRVHGTGAYHLDAKFDEYGPQPAPVLKPLPVELNLAFDDKPIAPYWVRGQHIHGVVSLTNHSSNSMTLSLAAKSSHVAYTPALESPILNLAPHVSAQVPIDVAVAPDAWSGDAVQIAVNASARGFTELSAHQKVPIDASALPLNQGISFPLPLPLRGGFDVAWKALGALPVVPGDERPEYIDALFDGMVSTTGYVGQASTLPKTITVNFGGGKSWPIAGITLHPQVAGAVYPAEQLADFDLLLSADGQQFDVVLSDRLTMLPMEQAFTLTKPYIAKAAQLRLKTNHADNLGKVGLSEWKVVTSPSETLGISINLGDPDRGGHIVRSEPLIGGAPAQARSLLEEGGRAEDVVVDAGVTPSFVVGFHENRAAMITSLEWVNSEKSDYNDHFEEVIFEASIDGPIGPWRPIGQLALKGNSETASKLTLPQPEWVRFLRVRSAHPALKRSLWHYPIALRIYERPTGAGYLSIIGEWGQFNHDAIYEATQAPPPPRLTTGPYNHGTHEIPAPLMLAHSVTGEVHLGQVEDWYGLDIPAGLNLLGLNLKGDPFVTAQVELSDKDGKKVAARVVSQSSNEWLYAAKVEPGRYLLHVVEPPHAVAIAFDTSGSLSQFAPIISHALRTFAEGVIKNREFVNFIDFGIPFLLEKWTDEAWVLVGALLHFQSPDAASSDLEPTMVDAMQGLQKRAGSRAIIVVTDAETPTYARQSDMWQFLTLIRPRIFSAQIGLGNDPVREKQIMQDLAAVNGGHYSAARTQAEMDVTSERAAAWLRRPARYELTADRLALPPVKPGSLEVRTVKSDAAPTREPPKGWGAVELVLDASGSMLQQIKGRKRIDIAKQTLTDLVNKTIPTGTQVAYRVFGDDKPGSCETNLRAPLTPLDRGAMTKLFSGIRSVNLAKTAIAASLRSVGQDLKAATGDRTVVLITDGEETCGGNPQKEIEALRTSGFDVRINIVGFAVEDKTLKDTFRTWAKLGGGNYFDASNDKELSNAVKAAVSLPLKVIDDTGAVVASGLVDGDSVALEPGIYTVQVGSGGAVFKDILVEQNEKTTLTYQGG